MILDEIPEIAKQKPLVVLFCWERYNLFKMVLPRVVNATRRIGGYLWVIDDYSEDERIRWILDRYLSEGYVDRVHYGTKPRFIDWASDGGPWGGACARRSVVLHFLTRRYSPLVIFCDPDVIVAPDAFETMLKAIRVARQAKLPASCYSGLRYSRMIFNAPEQRVQEFVYRLYAQWVCMQLSCVTLDTVRQVERESPWDFLGKWSLNQYGVWANRIGLEACYLMDVRSQHIGIGTTGRTFTDVKSHDVFAYEEDGAVLEVPGFDIAAFLNIADGTCVQIHKFAYWDHVDIEERRDVHPEFLRLKEIIGEN